ncbi:MAG: GNAT family N-acetyltransferase [Rickettsiaceae bacterium]|nr:GNAT family N-acetyltransferase [Rickettsiaceae bacterium]
MNKFILIETPRLILRTPKIEDAKPLNDAINRSLKELQRWQPWAYDPSLETTTKFIHDSINNWSMIGQKSFQVIVIHKIDNKIIAASGYNEKSDPSVPYYEIGYWLETAYTGQGLATELTNALTRYAFLELKAVRVQIAAQADNTKSINIPKRLGFEHEATLKKVRLDLVSKNPVDDYIFARFNLDGLPELDIKW